MRDELTTTNYIKSAVFYLTSCVIFIASLLYAVYKSFIAGIAFVFNFRADMLDINFFDSLYQSFTILIIGDMYFITALLVVFIILFCLFILTRLVTFNITRLKNNRIITHFRYKYGFKQPPKYFSTLLYILLISYLFILITVPIIEFPYMFGVKYAKNLKHDLKQMFIPSKSPNGLTTFYYNNNGKTDVFQAYPIVAGDNMVVVYINNGVVTLQKNKIIKILTTDNS